MSYVFLSYPIADRPEFQSMFTMYQSIMSCREHKVRLFANQNDSLISRIRCVHISMFLNEFKDCDYFMSLDSDLEIVNCYHTNNIFSKLIAHDKDFVGALYALKQHAGPPRTSSVPLDNSIERTSMPFDKGLLPMRWLSSGCMCLKRSAVEKMVQAYPELDYIGDDNVTGKKIHGLYKPDIFEIEDSKTKTKFKKYLSEDWSMCERWRQIGGEIFADTSIVLRHIGKFPYCLHNVEVIARKADEVIPQTTPVVSLNTKQFAPSAGMSVDTPEDVKRVAQIIGKTELPPAGWDLNNLINRKG